MILSTLIKILAVCMLGSDRLLFIPRSLFMIAIYILQHLAFMRGLRGLRRGYVQQLAASQSQMVCVVHKISMHDGLHLLSIISFIAKPQRFENNCTDESGKCKCSRCKHASQARLLLQRKYKAGLVNIFVECSDK